MKSQIKFKKNYEKLKKRALNFGFAYYFKAIIDVLAELYISI